MNPRIIALLRVVLVVLLLGGLLSQALVYPLADGLGGQYAETADLAAPYTVAAILMIVCIQVALVMVWRLLSLISQQKIFTESALRWVDVIMVCGAVAAVLPASVAFHLLVIVGVGGPGIVLAFAADIAGGAAFLLLMAVMRGLLQTAIVNRSELDGVI